MARPSRRASSPLPNSEGDMDLLEYQGKQLSARHGIPVPNGRPATTLDEALDAADAIGYPCVVKAQVQIGGGGESGGHKGAHNKKEGPQSGGDNHLGGIHGGAVPRTLVWEGPLSKLE